MFLPLWEIVLVPEFPPCKSSKRFSGEASTTRLFPSYDPCKERTRLSEASWSAEQNRTAGALAQKCFHLSWKWNLPSAKSKWSTSLKAKFNPRRKKCFVFKADWVFLFWDKLRLSGLLEYLTGLLILVPSRPDHVAAFGQSVISALNTITPLGTEAAQIVVTRHERWTAWLTGRHGEGTKCYSSSGRKN